MRVSSRELEYTGWYVGTYEKQSVAEGYGDSRAIRAMHARSGARRLYISGRAQICNAVSTYDGRTKPEHVP